LRNARTMHDQSHPNAVERSDADARLLAALGLGIAAFLLAAPFIVFAIYPNAPQLGRIPSDLRQPPTPRLQTAPKTDLERLRMTEERRLNSFGWVDRDKEIARIPIDDAMKLLVHRGMNGWPPSPPSATDQLR